MRFAWPAIAALLVATSPVPTKAQDDGEALFEARIRPVLVEKCFRCHGGEKTSNGLKVHSREALVKGGDRGAAIVPGEPEKSLLIAAIRRTHDEVQMPPDDKLREESVADFARWIKAGAPWPKYTTNSADSGDPAFRAAAHWAFRPAKKVAPTSDPSGWSDHPIDRFVSAKWRKKGLRPVAAADRQSLLRRVYFDLIGLPPTPEEAAQFLNDSSPDAFERLVDRLLASPYYGERWGRHWMDVVRYADTAGDNADYPIPEARLYRDYLIDSFNADKPYNRFVREQLAGDILAREGPPDRYAEQVVATGFLALSRRYATAPYEFWHLTLEDSIDTVGQSFLGLTLRCARCHDHKFDPISSDDYYALYGIFASTQYPWAGGEEFESKKFHRQHFAPLLSESDAARRAEAFRKQLDQMAAKLAELEKQLTAAGDADKPGIQKQVHELRAEHVQLQRSGLPPDVPGAYAVRDGQPNDAAIQLRGDPAQRGNTVPRRAISFLCPQPLEIPAGESGRKQLAQWLTRPDHPLTARVMVNRIWQHHFGRGIVATPSNFGTRGAAPTHPYLLDYLAARFVESGWSVKAMHRLILSSRTWQLSSADDDHNLAIDTGNELLWRHDRRRLDAEAIRDSLLSVSGRLDRSRPTTGHPFPPISDWHWTQHNPFKDVYDTSHRSVYLMTQRLQRHPFLALFDGPDTNTTTEKRTSATVPPQALYLMNSPEMAAIASSLAERLISNETDPARRIELAHRLCYARPPTEAEFPAGIRYIAEYTAEAARTAEGNGERAAWASYCRLLLSANEFFYVD
ncbi:MAG: PSD1 domain-containing protein [Planctomycetia bacterium]|nr:PSD1 domain-containing protein [Planctomycetia bacterium]